MRLGRVEVSAGCLLLLAWLNYWDTQGVVALGLLACLLHELAHYGALRLAGAGVHRVRLTAVGAEMEVEGNLSYGWDCLAALSGPGCNLLLALLCCRQPWGRLFAGLSLALGCFNLLPVGRLDGGRALYAGLAAAFGPGMAGTVCRWVEGVAGAALAAAGVCFFCLGRNVTLLLVALWIGAGAIPLKKRGNRACHLGWKRVQ